MRRENRTNGPSVLRDSASVIARDCSAVPRGLCSGTHVPSGKPLTLCHGNLSLPPTPTAPCLRFEPVKRGCYRSGPHPPLTRNREDELQSLFHGNTKYTAYQLVAGGHVGKL